MRMFVYGTVMQHPYSLEVFFGAKLPLGCEGDVTQDTSRHKGLLYSQRRRPSFYQHHPFRVASGWKIHSQGSGVSINDPLNGAGS